MADGHRQAAMESADAGRGRSRSRCTVPLFTFTVSCVVLFWMMGYAYITGVIRTLERRFGLSSAQSGLVLSSNDIMHVSVVMFVGYFGLRGNKPRLICVTTSLAAVGNLLMSLPHWLYSSDGPSSSTLPTYSDDCRSRCLCEPIVSHLLPQGMSYAVISVFPFLQPSSIRWLASP